MLMEYGFQIKENKVMYNTYFIYRKIKGEEFT